VQAIITDSLDCGRICDGSILRVVYNEGRIRMRRHYRSTETTTMKFRIVTASLLLLLLPTPLFAQGQAATHPWLQDDFIVSLGGYLPRKKFKVRVDGNTPASGINFDEGVDVAKDEATFSLTARWAFGEKWSLAGQYWATSDSSRATLEEDIGWGDYVLRAGSSIGAGVSVDVSRFFFGRKFSAGPNHEFGAGGGLHWLKLGAYVDGELFLDDQSTGSRRESVTAHAPLPNIGAWYWYAFSPKWLLTTRADWFGASFGDYSGDLWNANAGINFQPWKHAGFGLSYQYFRIDIDVDKTDWHGNVELTYSGPFLSANFNW
jgi:hypothetical protein